MVNTQNPSYNDITKAKYNNTLMSHGHGLFLKDGFLYSVKMIVCIHRRKGTGLTNTSREETTMYKSRIQGELNTETETQTQRNIFIESNMKKKTQIYKDTETETGTGIETKIESETDARNSEADIKKGNEARNTEAYNDPPRIWASISLCWGGIYSPLLYSTIQYSIIHSVY